MTQQLSIQLGPRHKFKTISLRTFKHGENAYVGFITASQPVTLYGPRQSLIHALRTMADELEGVSPPPQTRPHPQASTWDWLTPRFVVDYLYNSSDPGLRELAPMVEAHFGTAPPDPIKQDVKTVLKQLDPHQLFELDGQPIWGAQKQIADALNISNGGSHRKRILPVLNTLKEKYFERKAA